MEQVACLDSSPIECASPSTSAAVWQDVLAHAITGELLAAMNYTSLAEICDDPAEIADALEHAQNERGHAGAFAAEGRRIGVEAANNVEAKHWKRLRETFLRCVSERDVVGCLIVQEIMLESFALASYSRAGRVGPGTLGQTFARIAAEEEEHIGHAVAILRTERARDAQSFDEKLYHLHLEVMTTLSQMLAKDCSSGHCEVCHASCVKPALFEISLSASQLRGASLQQYLKTLDMLGIPGQVTLAWVAQLPV